MECFFQLTDKINLADAVIKFTFVYKRLGSLFDFLANKILRRFTKYLRGRFFSASAEKFSIDSVIQNAQPARFCTRNIVDIVCQISRLCDEFSTPSICLKKN